MKRAGLLRCGIVLAMVCVSWRSGCPGSGTPLDPNTVSDPNATPTPTPTPTATPTPTGGPLKLVFIHHSVGEGWLSTDGGNLRQALNENGYFVTDTNYGWGPADADAGFGTIGDHTDVGHWYNWFLGPHRDTYLSALYTNTHLTEAAGTNTIADPGGENVIVMFKSCFTNGQALSGDPNEGALAAGVANPIYGQGEGDAATYSVSNIKGLYRDLLTYFAAHQDKLFILVTTPPSLESPSVDSAMAARLRGISDWLVNDWLTGYPHRNVAVFDYGLVLTGGHHRYVSGAVEHTAGPSDFLAYPSEGGDNHPTATGHQRAVEDFIPLLNYYVNRWQNP